MQNLANVKLGVRQLAQLLGLVSLLTFSSMVMAEGAGTVTHLSGILKALRADGATKILSVKSDILQGDILQTEKDTFARIKFIDGGEVVLRPGTVFKVQSYAYAPDSQQDDNIALQLVKGGMRSVTGLLGKRSPDKFKMETVVATIGIRGTHFGALLCNDDCADIATVASLPPEDFLPAVWNQPLENTLPAPCQSAGGFLPVAMSQPLENIMLAEIIPPPNGLHTDTAAGSISVTNAAGTIVVPAGSFSHTPNANTPPKIVPPSQGIQVTMPTSISNNESKGKSVGKDGKTDCGL